MNRLPIFILAAIILLILGVSAFMGSFLIMLQMFAIFAAAPVLMVAMGAYFFTVTRNLTNRFEKTDSAPAWGVPNWAEKNNFETAGHYLEGSGRSRVYIAAWRHRERPTFFYTMNFTWGKSRSYYTTVFANRAHLTTGTSWTPLGIRNPPWAYDQFYSDKSSGELWEQHLEGENYLMDAGGAELVESDVWFEVWFVESKEEQVTYMRSIPFWPFRIYWWIFRILRMENLSIQQQHERGWIRMPNEIRTTKKPE